MLKNILQFKFKIFFLFAKTLREYWGNIFPQSDLFEKSHGPTLMSAVTRAPARNTYSAHSVDQCIAGCMAPKNQNRKFKYRLTICDADVGGPVNNPKKDKMLEAIFKDVTTDVCKNFGYAL